MWRRLLALLGVRTAATVRAEGLADRAAIGAHAEKATGAQLWKLETRGWQVFHGRHIPGGRADLDHVLVPPDGTAVIILDTKAWHAAWYTQLKHGRLHCGTQDRHGQVEAVAGYARRVQMALGMPGVAVVPLVVVHGSQVRGAKGEYLEAPVDGGGRVFVLGIDRLVPELIRASKGIDSDAACRLAARVQEVLPPHPGSGVR
ncbi:nuclease-related domain-containing protein [Streptomyces sp. NPDC093509]|uniref:nuclease-related domain-containing protein n=1 Tax=Streptomyces sp. NPDC093509 TaxID=3154982 RepID=UPI00344C43FC